MSFMKNEEGVLLTEIPKDYSDGRTKQSFKDATDINKLLYKAQRTGTLSHLQKYGGQYGDFSDFDYMDAQNQLAQAKTIFEELPSEIRREFGNDPGQFFEYANDPGNVGKLAEMLPALAEPGRQRPAVIRTAGTETAEIPPHEHEVVSTPPETPPEEP